MNEMQMKKTDSSQIGYGRPPKAHQFQPGQSGNPSGRPKGTRSFLSDLRDELAEVVSVVEGHKTVEVTKQRAIIKALVRQAVAGDARAIATIVGSCARVFEAEASDQDAPEDSAILDAFLARPSKGAGKSTKIREKHDGESS